MNKPTKPQLIALKDIWVRQKKWPVGVSFRRDMAKRLVSKELCEYAPPVFGGKYLGRNYYSVRLTSLGELYAEGRL